MKLANQFKPFSPPETNFLERLRYWALAQPEALAYRFLVNGEDDVVELTFAELDHRARALAARLVSMGYAGKRALMMYPSGLDFVIAFFACHYAGVVPVPAYPPRRNRNLTRINAISDDVQASVALTVSNIIKHSKRAARHAPSLQRIPWVATEDVPAELASDWISPKINNDDLAVIQYTSGSTGSPKGVMLTHWNLMANCAMITESFEISRDGGGGAAAGFLCTMTWVWSVGY